MTPNKEHQGFLPEHRFRCSADDAVYLAFSVSLEPGRHVEGLGSRRKSGAG